MKILITGTNGFLGKNLHAVLTAISQGKDFTATDIVVDEVLSCNRMTAPSALDRYCAEADFVFHLAGVNRSMREEDFVSDNIGFTEHLLNLLRNHNNSCPIVFASSVQAGLQGEYDNPYGRSKRKCEQLLFEHQCCTGAAVYVYRLPNVFGKWCRPHYNSVVATFCSQLCNDLPIEIFQPNRMLTLLYMDDLMQEMLSALRGKPCTDGTFCKALPEYSATVQQIADMLRRFHDDTKHMRIPQMPEGSLEKKLFSTYLSYLPSEQMALPLKMNVDHRGSFTELLKMDGTGQVSVNVTKPGITKGEHWHHSKCEVFVVVSGEGLIRQKKLGTDEIIEYCVNGKNMEAIRILPGFVHSIINMSDNDDLVTVMWANEAFSPERPDTFSEKVMG